jgi:hypothetical protein
LGEDAEWVEASVLGYPSALESALVLLLPLQSALRSMLLLALVLEYRRRLFR